MSGAARKNSQLKPVTSAFVKVSDVDDGKLGVRIPAEPEQREGEIAAPDPHVDAWAPHQPVLEEEDGRQHEQRRATVIAIETVFVFQIFSQSGSSTAPARESVSVVERRPWMAPHAPRISPRLIGGARTPAVDS